MATIVRRENKSGVTYRIQVKTKDKGSGKITTHSTTWKPVPGMTEKQIQREVIVFADKYEDQLQAAAMAASGEKFMTAETTLADYAEWWLERRREEISASYYVSSKDAIADIAAHIDTYKLRELNPAVIQRFFDSVDKRERTIVTYTALPEAIRQRMREVGRKYQYLRYEAGLSSNTLSIALRGGHVCAEFAERLAKELKTEAKKLFDLTMETAKYAYETCHKIKQTPG